MRLTPISEAKQRLPLPQLLAKIGDAERDKKSACCPFHDDKNASFSVFQTGAGVWLWKCHAGCGQGDGVDYLEKRFRISTGDAIRRYRAEAGLNSGKAKPATKTREAFDWPACVAAFTAKAKRQLAEWRGLSIEFVEWLHGEKIVGSHSGKLAFAVQNQSGIVISCHKLVDREKRQWAYEPKDKRTHPLVFGDTRQAGFVLCFESQWDAFAVMDRLAWHTGDGLPDASVLITRGAQNGKLIADKCSPDAVVLAFAQNDAPDLKTGRIPSEDWLKTVAAHAGCKVLRVTTPPTYKDSNDWTRAGANKDEIESAIRDAKLIEVSKVESVESGNGADFDRLTAWIRGEILALLLADGVSPATKRSQIAKKVVEALGKLGRFYFHAERRDFDSTMHFNTHSKRLERLRSDAFAAWLSEWLNVNRADSIFRFVTAEVETAALTGQHTTGILPEAFWSSRAGAIYLSNGDGQAVKITAAEVQIMDNGSDGVLFAAGKTLAPWKVTVPHDAFETCKLFAKAHCTAAHGKDLLRLWLYSLPTNPRSKPPLCLAGDVGSGKTRTAKGIAELYGLPFIAQKVEEDAESNFWPCINKGGIYCLDNADTKCRWLADALANAATDGCSQRRKLYTNAETVTLRARAWLAITTANPTFANDAGLADRLLLVRMGRTEDDTSDAALSDEIAANRNAALSHIAETLRSALADTGPTPPGLNTRHPDFASFAIKIGRALGRESETITALRTAEADKSAFCLENDPIGAALLAYLHDARIFTGTAAELAPHLVAMDEELNGRLSAKRLGKRLSMIWKHLQKALAVAKKESDRKGFTQFRLETAECAEFQTAFSVNPLREGEHMDFRENPETNSAHSANPGNSKELIEAAAVGK